MRLRYTRWQDRVLAAVWPPKRRRLRMQEALLGERADEIARDLFLYGTAFVGPDGKRIDPTTVRVYER